MIQKVITYRHMMKMKTNISGQIPSILKDTHINFQRTLKISKNLKKSQKKSLKISKNLKKNL